MGGPVTEVDAKWEVYDRCNQDKSKAKGVYDMVYRRCKIDTWPEKWTPAQINEFRKYLNLLLPTDPKWSKLVDDIIEVFGDVEEKKYE